MRKSLTTGTKKAIPRGLPEGDIDLSQIDVGLLSRADQEELIRLLESREKRFRERKLFTYFPDTGPLRRELYQKHLSFFEAGLSYRERCALCANRVGKTEGMGGYELALHLTGLYPVWWQGRRFEKQVKAWASGTTGQTTRDILQAKLLGPVDAIGTGLIPADMIIETNKKAGNVPDVIESAFIRHVSGGVSVLGFKSAEQGRKAFEGTEQDVILLDEEHPLDIYTECLTRTMSTVPGVPSGLIMCTFTPLEGITEMVLQFMPGGKADEQSRRFLIQATWDDVPHLSETDKAEMLESYPLHQRDARSKGVPQLGSGAIYPIPEDFISVADFELPEYWPRAYGFDVGWNATAAIWGAVDRENDTAYLYACYKRGQAEPAVHSSAIQLRGDWIPGVSDPAAMGSNQKDGTKLMYEYADTGLILTPADNAVEAGIFEVYRRFSTGRLKVFKSLAPFFEEYRLYRRDKRGKVVKESDHLMDCCRYFVMSGINAAITKPIVGRFKEPAFPASWMAA